MGLFSKFRENNEEQSSGEVEAVSLIEMLEHSVQSVREAVLGSSGVEAGDALPRGLAMEDPFSQSDHAVLAAVVEHDVRASSPEERKTIVQTVRESLAQSAHVMRDAVLSHTTTTTADQQQQANGDGYAATPIEDVVDVVAAPEEEQSRGIIAAVGDIMAHPVQTMKDIVASHSSDVVEASSSGESSGVEQATSSNGVSHLESHGGDEEEVKGLIQTVKEAAMEVKEEMMEVVHEVKDVVMSTDTLPNVQTESITEDAGERPSMELVHTIVHD